MLSKKQKNQRGCTWTPGKCPCAPLSILLTLGKLPNNDGQSQKIPVPRPTAVAEYNKYMGGVDTSDQMLGTNSVHGKTRRWPVIVFQHLLDIAVTNSFIVHKELSKAQQQKAMTSQAFQEELSAHLLGVPLFLAISEMFKLHFSKIYKKNVEENSIPFLSFSSNNTQF